MSLGTTCNGKRFALLGGSQPSNAIFAKGGVAMNITEIIAVITLAFTTFMFGFWIGTNAKR